MKALVPASGRQIAYVRRWFNANPDAIEEQERQFLKNGLDVVPLVSATRSPTMERLKELCPAFITKLFPAKNVSDPEGDSSASGAQYSNDSRGKADFNNFYPCGIGVAVRSHVVVGICIRHNGAAGDYHWVCGLLYTRGPVGIGHSAVGGFGCYHCVSRRRTQAMASGQLY